MPEPTNLNRQLTAAIRSELRNQKISQHQLGLMTGYTDKHISRTLKGYNDGTFEFWQNIAHALGMTWNINLIDLTCYGHHVDR